MCGSRPGRSRISASGSVPAGTSSAGAKAAPGSLRNGPSGTARAIGRVAAGISGAGSKGAPTGGGRPGGRVGAAPVGGGRETAVL